MIARDCLRVAVSDDKQTVANGLLIDSLGVSSRTRILMKISVDLLQLGDHYHTCDVDHEGS